VTLCHGREAENPVTGRQAWLPSVGEIYQKSAT